MRPAIWLWCARVAWAVLPVTAGGALADALDSWGDGPARVATACLWIAWSAGLLALFAPRPWGCTLLRVVAPLALVGALCSISSTTAGSAALAVASSFVAAALALSAPVTDAAGNALAYGDEVRLPLRIPTALLLVPVPIAIGLVGAGAVSGVLLLAAGSIAVGVVVTLVGVPIALVVARSLHTLSCRWLVLVPAGITVVDPLSLADPVLVRREEIASVRRVGATPSPPGVLDLRLGTVVGGVRFDLAAPVGFAPRRGRTGSELLEPDGVAVAVARPRTLLALAQARRITTH